MEDVDLNLLAALDALLDEGSVTGAARRLGLSPSAMSRTLARLREATGDRLLVRAGRSLVPTPRASALREPVRDLAREARAVLQPRPETIDPATLARRFVLRASEGFLELLATRVADVVGRSAPHVRLRFVSKPDHDPRPLRDGEADLEIGLGGRSAPEMRTRTLFHDRLVGVARAGHALLQETITPARYAACRHVATLRGGEAGRALDAALERLGLGRTVMVQVPGYPDAMRVARCTELVALVPRSCLGHAADGNDPEPPGLAAFDLPVPVPGFAIAAMWHPRAEADPAHRWLRETVIAVCREAYPG